MSGDLKAVLVGTPDKLYDLRYPGALDGYRRVEREVGESRARLVYAGAGGERVEVVVEVRPVAVGAARPANGIELKDVLLTYAGAPAMEDPADPGALAHYHEVARRDEGDATVLTLLRRGNKGGLELSIAVRPVG